MHMVIPALWALWLREMRKFVRERSRVIGAFAQPLGFWALLGFGFGGTFQIPGATSVSYLSFLFPGIITLIALFTAIYSTISVVQERQEGFLQAALVAPIPRWVLVVGTSLGGVSLALAQALLFMVAVPFLGLAPSVFGIFLTLLGVILLALSFSSLGLVMAWKVSSTRGYHALMNIVLMPLWLLSSGPFPLEGTPAVLKGVMLLNPVTHGVGLIRAGLYWPDASPVGPHGTWFSLAYMALFTLFMAGWAVRTVRKRGGM